MCIKSEFKEIILKLATNGQNDPGFLMTSKLSQGLSAPGLGLYICIEALKNMYNIRLQGSVFKT